MSIKSSPEAGIVPHPDMRDEGTPAEQREAGELAMVLYRTLQGASTPKVRLAAAGMLLQMAFTSYVQQKFRVRAWEDYCYWTRQRFVKESRDARD